MDFFSRVSYNQEDSVRNICYTVEKERQQTWKPEAAKASS